MSDAEEGALLAVLGTRRAVRIVVAHAQGSVPRDAGTWMAVVEGDETLIGTIGGGRLELDAVTHARDLLAGRQQALQRRYPLGPSLGQCCGGVVELRFEHHDANTREGLRNAFQTERRSDMPVALFGGGHVGRAIARALSALPMRLHWIDSREEIFPSANDVGLSAWPQSLRCEHSTPVHDAVRDIEPGAHVLIMSFSHAEDFDILAACLRRRREHDDLPFIGLIGSKTKWATFRHRLEARGFTADELAQHHLPDRPARRAWQRARSDCGCCGGAIAAASFLSL